MRDAAGAGQRAGELWVKQAKVEDAVLDRQPPFSAAHPARGHKAHLGVGQVQVLDHGAVRGQVQRCGQAAKATQQQVNLGLANREAARRGVNGDATLRWVTGEVQAANQRPAQTETERAQIV